MDIRPPRKRPLNEQKRPSIRSANGIVSANNPDARPVDLPHTDVRLTIDQQYITQSESSASVTTEDSRGKKTRRSLVLWIIGVVIGLFLLIVALLVVSYFYLLSPVSGSANRTRITIEAGETPSQIAETLHHHGLIRSKGVFELYTKLSGTRNQLKAGSYALSPAQSTDDIVTILVSGKTETLSVLLYPGGTLRDTTNKPRDQKTDVYTALLRAGYSEKEVESALEKQYNHPLLADKPASASLEGYIYGDTYVVDSSASVEDVLNVAFDEFYEVLTDNGLIDGFKEQGLTLHQGIIMASIIQSEMGSQESDMAQVAQIFFKRYKQKMPLGSDVTAYYGADLLGMPRAVSVDSPYNTRIHMGLPKGPISNPGIAALKAVASPAKGDYVYFLSGDDGRTYFAVTNEQHEKNIVDHCKVGCSIP